MIDTKTTTITLSIDNLLTVPAPLHCKFMETLDPRPAYVELSKDGNVTANYDLIANHYDSIRDTSPSAYRWIDLRFTVNPCVSGKALHTYLNNEGLSLLKRIHAGHVILPDERDKNILCGDLDYDGFKARGALLAALEDLPRVTIASADDWIFAYGELHEYWSGRPLADVVSELEIRAASLRDSPTPWQIEGDVKEALLEEALFYFHDNGRRYELLDEFHVSALLETGRITPDLIEAQS